MDPIIRAAAVSPTTHQLRRLAPARTTASVQADAAAAAAAAPGAGPATLSAAALPVPAPPAASDPELLAARAALSEREADIAGLRAAAHAQREALEQLRADAEQRGRMAGEEQGERAGRELLQAQVERVKALLIQIGQSRQQVLDSAEDEMLDIAFGALCRILGEQGARRETVREVVRSAVLASRSREQVLVRLHPDDAALLRREADTDADGVASVRLCADIAVALGGCLVESGNGSLDVRFETQLGLLAAALGAVRAERAAARGEGL